MRSSAPGVDAARAPGGGLCADGRDARRDGNVRRSSGENLRGGSAVMRSIVRGVVAVVPTPSFCQRVSAWNSLGIDMSVCASRWKNSHTDNTLNVSRHRLARRQRARLDPTRPPSPRGRRRQFPAQTSRAHQPPVVLRDAFPAKGPSARRTTRRRLARRVRPAAFADQGHGGRGAHAVTVTAAGEGSAARRRRVRRSGADALRAGGGG